MMPGKVTGGKGVLPGLAYRITGEPPEARLEFEPDPVEDVSADDLLGEAGAGTRGPREKKAEAPKLEEATMFLIERLQDGKGQLWETLKDDWMDVHGGKERTLRRARTQLGLRSRKAKRTGKWLVLPPKVRGPEWGEAAGEEDGHDNLANPIYGDGQHVGPLAKEPDSLPDNLAKPAQEDGRVDEALVTHENNLTPAGGEGGLR